MSRAGLPKTLCNLDRCYLKGPPPCHLIAATVQFVMMITAQRNSEFVANLPSECFGLRKFEVVGVAWCALADHTRLGRNESQVRLISAT